MTEAKKPWQGLDFKLSPEAEALCLACIRCELGDGRKLKFWTSNWLDGQSIASHAPNLMQFVSQRAMQLTIAEALPNHRWVADIRGAPSIPAIAEFLDIWELVDGTQLGIEEDKLTWKLTANGAYSSKSAYAAFFAGMVDFPCARELWASGAPLLHKLHMWFALRGRLWTADWLSRRGLEHLASCPLCCQEQESTEHLTMQCSFAREVWYSMLLPLRLHRFTPTAQSTIAAWWRVVYGLNATVECSTKWLPCRGL